MAVSALWYGQALLRALNKEIDFNEASKIKCMLMSAYTVNQDTHTVLSEATAAGTEATGTGYTAGGAVMTNCAVTYDAGTNVIKLDADDVSWTSSTITASYAIVYYDTTVASTSPVLFYINFDGAKSSSNGTFSIVWNASGIGTVTVSAT